MRKFISIAAFAVVFACVTAADAQPEGFRYMAFCSDADGALTEWVTTREDAYAAGRDHERSHRGHRWEVMVQHGRTAIGPASCSVVSEPSDKPGIVRVSNTCGACRIVRVSRRNADGSVKSKEFKIKPNGQRHFRKVPDSEIVVEGEGDCPGT